MVILFHKYLPMLNGKVSKHLLHFSVVNRFITLYIGGPHGCLRDSNTRYRPPGHSENSLNEPAHEIMVLIT